jgi:ubiquinone/menaquinone biosynthesis C-methylase UbiE
MPMNNQTTEPDRRNRVRNHFDELAETYDTYKQNASYYYLQLKKVLMELIGEPSGKSILEIGCGTGELLAEMSPRVGCGIDISEKMIEVAEKRWADRPELSFYVDEAETLSISGDWDIVIMADVLEHLYDSGEALKRIGKMLNPETKLILTWANNHWAVILHMLEFLKLKMPEGDHCWEDLRSVTIKLIAGGFDIRDSGTRCLVPARLPLADPINRLFHKMPILRNMGLIRYIVAERCR